MPKMPVPDPLPPAVEREIAKLRQQIAELWQRVAPDEPKNVVKDIHWSHDGPVIEGSRSTPYVVQWANAEIIGIIAGCKEKSDDDTIIGVFVNGDLVDTVTLEGDEKTMEDWSINAVIKQYDRVQVGIEALGEDLEGLTVLVKIKHPSEDPFLIGG